MNHSSRRLTLSGLLLACLLGCADSTTGPDIPLENVLPVKLQTKVGEEDFKDQLQLSRAWIEGRFLRVVVSSACTGGTVDAVAPLHLDGDPLPTLDLFLIYSEPVDSCGTFGVDTLTIDLRNAFAVHDRHHNRSSPWIIRLGSMRFSEPSPHYDFMQLRLPWRDSPASSNETYEASQVALWLSGALESPVDMTQALHTELTSIRDAYRGQIPALDAIHFVPPHDATSFYMFVDEPTAQAMFRNEYRAWDALNEWIEVDAVRIKRWRVVTLSYRRELHPQEVTERYASLPGVICTRGNAYFNVYRKNVYPRGDAGSRSYLFQYGWGDCPSGCLTYRYLYFERRGEGFALTGDWTTGTAERPAWWPEAQKNIDLYQAWQSSCIHNDCGLVSNGDESLW